ncbi:MAG: ribonuclease HII [Minisyncoccia bacterium]
MFILGVDEAGRGPLAGPVAVGVVIAPQDFDFHAAFLGLNDSKQLSEKKRERIFEQLKEYEQKGEVRFHVSFSSAKVIDQKGITLAVKDALEEGVRLLLPNPSEGRVFLDGLLYAPEEYEQETIIKGDTLIPAIMLASVAAKVTRDRHMVELAKRFPEYGFEKHKGYGTQLHQEALQKYGLCDIHRRSFCKLQNT